MIIKALEPFRKHSRPARRKGAGGPPTPVNVNLLRVFETVDGALLLIFDGPVTVNTASPPTTWSFHGVSGMIQGGCVNYGTSTSIILNTTVNPGDAVVIAADDPGARTPSGGYVNAASLTILDM